MIKERFILKEGSRLLLYGAASFGTLLFEKLQHSKYFVEGFIDQRADEIPGLKGKPVYSIQDAVLQFSDADIIVVISVKNVFEHSKIAAKLYDEGLKNIIYKPYAVLNNVGTKEENAISKIFDDFLQGNFKYDVSLNQILPGENFIHFSEKYLLEQDRDFDVVFLSLLALFENKDLNSKKQERNVLFFFPHIQFFKFLQGNAKASARYYVRYCEMAAEEINSFARTDAWRENVIRNRTQIFEEMNQAYIFNRDFFQTSAPEVVWNDKGYFNLTSGKHRAAFFASKKNAYIPVKMSHTDSIRWLNKGAAKKVLEMFAEKGVMELKAPVEHPYFYQYPCNSTSFFYGVCATLAEKISRLYYVTPLDNYIDGKCVYLSLDDYGLLGRFFARCGALVYEERKKDTEVVKALDELFYTQGRREEKKEKYDIAVAKVENKNEIQDRCASLNAKHWFFVGPLSLLTEDQNLECIYNGVAWERQMAIGYMEIQDV
ncbi:MAG: hypothetical protein NC307_12520 [Roseburia sp.]|nr:hypothetical protein [Roseburia sp.]